MTHGNSAGIKRIYNHNPGRVAEPKTVTRSCIILCSTDTGLKKKICNLRHFHYIRAVIMTNGYYIFFMTVMSMRMHR